MSTPTLTCEHSTPDFLLRRINYERTTTVPYLSVDFKLDRMRRLLGLLGDPHLGLKAIHIAGTKGKGSTAAMVAQILQSAGHRTGLYTSPHLDRIEERIQVDGQPCPADQFQALANQVEPAVELLDAEAAAVGANGPTFFEVTTAMAFLHFAQAKVAAVVLEVGLGGRLDSTNVCQPEVCIITSISVDHTRQLGNTLAAIAGEKAGIIKPHIPIISGVVDAEPRDVIAAKAIELRAPLIQRGVHYNISIPHSTTNSHLESFDYHEQTFNLYNLRLSLLGRHQAANAAAAIAAINSLRGRGWAITDHDIRHGLLGARCAARIEQISTAPAVVLDVAHNLASIEALLTVLRERFSPSRRILIFASSKDKDYCGMLGLLLPAFDTIFLTNYIDNPRAMPAESLLAIAQEMRAKQTDRTTHPILHATARPEDALRLARAIATPQDLICITGSFFLAAELRPLL
jgi:dihydrofolate synthase / folylpolyglutamate synthase